MKLFSKTILLLFIISSGYAQSTFEGTMKWDIKVEFVSEAVANDMKQKLSKVDNQALQKEIQLTEMKMNDTAFQAKMKANPALKAQMEQKLALMKTLSPSIPAGMDPLEAMMPRNLTIKTKDSNYVIQMKGGMASTLGDILYLKKTKKKYLIKNIERTYSILDDKKDSSVAKAKVTATGEYEKIMNYNARKYIVETTKKGKKITQLVWASKDLKEFNSKSLADIKIGSSESGVDFSRIEGAPLKMIITNEEFIVTLIAKELNKEPVDPSLFVIPKDYKEVPAASYGR